MPFIPTDAFPVDLLPDGDVRPLADVVWTGTRGDSVTIRARRRSNLGNVPKLLRGVLPHDGAAARGFLVHDELCELLHERRRAVEKYLAPPYRFTGEDAEAAVPPTAFDAVDTDAVLRVVLAELGVGPVRWIYWEGVRLGALGPKARRRGFLRPRSIVPFVLLAPVAVLCVLPAAVGALVSRALLALWAGLCWPWERRARAKRAATVERVRAVARGRATIARGAARRDDVLMRASSETGLPPVTGCGLLCAPGWSCGACQPVASAPCLNGCDPSGARHWPTCPNRDETPGGTE